MYLIAKVVQICFANAKKYNLDFRGITLAGPNGEGEGGTGFNTSGGAGTSAQQDATFGSSRRGGAPTANQGSKRTRVSFLLYWRRRGWENERGRRSQPAAGYWATTFPRAILAALETVERPVEKRRRSPVQQKKDSTTSKNRLLHKGDERFISSSLPTAVPLAHLPRSTLLLCFKGSPLSLRRSLQCPRPPVHPRGPRLLRRGGTQRWNFSSQFARVQQRAWSRLVVFLGDFEHSRLALFFGSPVHNLASKCFLFCRLCCSNVQCLAKFPQGEEKRRGRKFSNLQHFPSTPVRRGSVLSQIRCTRIPIFPFGLSIGHPKDQLQQIFSSGSVNP